MKTYNYILNTLLRVAPFFAGSILDTAIKKTGHTVDTISAGEMLKIIKSEVLPKLSTDRDILTDSLILANTTTIQLDNNNKFIHTEGPLKSFLEDDFNFEFLLGFGFVEKTKNVSKTLVREIPFQDNLYKVSITPIFNNQKKIVGSISTIANLTLQREIEEEIVSYSETLRKEIDARIEAEDELKLNQSLLFQSSKLVALGQMASGIAHEINNPLASLKLSITLLKKLQEKEKLTLEKADHERDIQLDLIDRISNTITSMRELSRQSSITDFRKNSVKKIIKDVAVFLGDKISVNDVSLLIDMDKEDVQLFCQETQIGQVLINLIDNALDEIVDQYKDPWIELDWSRTRDYTYITVTDCGHGIPEEKTEKIFDPFFTEKMDQGGTGLGLSISSQILKAHKGHLYVDNEHSNTRFVLSLPNNV